MKILRTLPVAAVVFFTAACTTQPVQPHFGTCTVDTLLTGQDVQCHVKLHFVSILNAAKSPALQAVEEANINYFYELEGFTGPAAEAARTALLQITAEYAGQLPPGSVGADYEISAEAEGTVVDTLIVYTISRESFTGGAHGMYETVYHTYSLNGGYELTLADMFDERQIQRLREAIYRKICEQYDAANDEELIARGFFPEYIDVTENFLVSPEGLTFCYNPYDIGCYALGPVEVELTRDEVAEIRHRDR